MHQVTATGATDSANILLFWPENLPDTFDADFNIDAFRIVERMRDEGRLIWFLCDGDGEYTLGIYLDTTIPDQLQPFCTDPEEYPTLSVRGVGYFGGAEYAFKHESKRLEKHPGMCEKVEVPEGTYSALVYRTLIPNALRESWLLDSVGWRTKQVGPVFVSFYLMSALGVVGSLLMICISSWMTCLYAFAVTATLGAATFFLSRSKTYKALMNAEKEFGKEFPEYVVHLKSQS